MATAFALAFSSAPTAYTLTPSAAELDFHRRAAERARRHEAPAWRRAGFVPGARVAEVGCGVGMVTAELAELVGPHGHVVGVESDDGTRATAGDVLRARGVRNAHVVAGEASATGLEAASRDAIMLRHGLAQNGRQARDVVRHLATRLRPGGALYLVETDVAALRFLPYDRHLDEQRSRFLELLMLLGNDLWTGSKLGDSIADAGLELVERDARWEVVSLDADVARALGVRTLPAMRRAGVATERDCERWEAAWTRFAAEPGDKIVFTPMFHAIGRRRRMH